jgi:type VI secretion system secreted protein VgrG
MRQLAPKLSLVLLIASAASLRADTLGLLGTAGGFAVLGGATVTSTGASSIVGNLGAGTGTTIPGFPPGSLTAGATYISDATTAQALSDALAAFNALSALASTDNLTGQNLGGLVLTPGVYSFASSAQLTGDLTLNFGGLSNQTIVIQTGSTLTTASGALVQIVNAGLNDSVYWDIGSSATLGTGTGLTGYLLALQSITLNSGAGIASGNALALNGSVTLNDSAISLPLAPAQMQAGQELAPEPASLWLVATGLLAAMVPLRRRLLAA